MVFEFLIFSGNELYPIENFGRVIVSGRQMMTAHGIPVSAQEMIIRRQKDRFIVEIVPNVLHETRRRPPVAAATGLPDICQISPVLLLRPPIFVH